MIPQWKIYPRSQGHSTVYLQNVVTAKPIRKRFSDEEIAQLLELKWWDWPEEKIAKSIDAIQSGDLEGLKRAKL